MVSGILYDKYSPTRCYSELVFVADFVSTFFPSNVSDPYKPVKQNDLSTNVANVDFQCFESVTSILFMASTSEFDQVLSYQSKGV